MKVEYLHLQPDQTPPPLSGSPFRAVIVAEVDVGDAWRERIAEWVVKGGCLYALAWGIDCEEWHDSIDLANLKAFDFRDIPDEHFIMTTWHPKEPLKETLWFAGQCAHHPDVDLDLTMIIHISAQAREAELRQTFSDSQILADD